MLRLYYAPNACSLASHIALEEAGAQYDAVRVDFSKNEQRSPAFLKRNPNGRVPVLETDHGVLTENAVILGWIAQTYPEAKLKPPGDFFAFSRMQMFTIFLATNVHPVFGRLFRPERYGEGADVAAAIKAKVPEALADPLGQVEARLRDGRPWAMGEHYTVADPYLFVFARWLERKDSGGIDRFPHILAHRTRMNTRPAVRRTLAAEDIPVL